jgi:hypothetical protein
MRHSFTTTVVTAVLMSAIAFAQNSAASFPGTGPAGIDVPHHGSLVPITGITVEAWVYRATSSATNHRAIVRKNSMPFNESYNLRVTDGAARWIIKTSVDGTVQLNTSSTVSPGAWHHMAGTFDNTKSRVYLDGTLIGEIAGLTGPLFNTGFSLLIGNGDSEPWWGLIDCVRVWSYARTAPEIQSTMLYQITNAPGLVSSWHLDSNYLDSTGSNHGTAIGSIPFAPGAPLLSPVAAPAVTPVGSPLTFVLNHQTPAQPYILDVSVTGTSPGVPISPGMIIPLNQPWLNFDTGAALSTVFVNFFGFTDAAGHAVATLNVPNVPMLAGITVNASYVAIDPLAPSAPAFIAPPSTTIIAGPSPSVVSVTPMIGVVTGATPLTIVGSHFAPGASVRIGTTPATNVTTVSSSQITCLAPPGTLGPKNVVVTNPDTLTATLANGFTYVAVLALTQVTPLIATAGTPITVSGSGIQVGATVSVGGITVAPTSVTATAITFVNPPGVPCDASIQVMNPDGQIASRPFNPSPALLLALPASGLAAGGNQVSVFGMNYLPGTTVTVNGTPATATILGPSSLTIVMPPGMPGPAAITVTSVTGCSGSISYTYT